MQRMLGIAALGAALVLIIAACSKGSESSANAASQTAVAATGAVDGASASDGGKFFTTNCSSCHQTHGQGLPGTFPPLAGNPVVTGDPKTVIHIVKFGLTGKVAVAGQNYNGQMPAWKGTLSDSEIASVLTYIRSAWGNTAGGVSAADVTAVTQ